MMVLVSARSEPTTWFSFLPFSLTNFCSLGILVTFVSSMFQIHRGSVILYFCIMPVTYSLNQARTDCCVRDEAQFLLICDAFLTLSFLWCCIKLHSHLYPAASYFTLNPFILFSHAHLYAVCRTFLPVSGKPFLANLAKHFVNSHSSFSFRTFGLQAPPLLWPSPFMMFFSHFLKDKYAMSMLIDKWCGWFGYVCYKGLLARSIYVKTLK